MVIAASLSQVQNLLQYDALQSKPQLLETFDRALTGCRVVYGCLEEEVRELVLKSQNEDLKFKDKAKFLWKEETFKELLQQIRGQQSALSLLIQGLQMESMADIRKLVEANSSKLDQVVKRSRTLRQSHPRIQVPESIFSPVKLGEDAADADSILKSTRFGFDNEVINSKAYRRAMAMYASKTGDKIHLVSEKEFLDEDMEASTLNQEDVDFEKDPARLAAPETARTTENAKQHNLVSKSEPTDYQSDALDSIEQDILPYMPRITSTASYLTSRGDIDNAPKQPTNSTPFPAPIRSYSEGFHAVVDSVPPLPPRHPGGQRLRTEKSMPVMPKARSASSDTVLTSEPSSILSTGSTVSSYTVYESSSRNFSPPRKPMRKPLPMVHKASHNIVGSMYAAPSISSSPKYSEIHSIWLALVNSEQKFIDRMTKLRTLFYDNITREWPLLEKHLEAILIGEQMVTLNKRIVLDELELQVSRGESSICDPSLFENWAYEIQKAYREYCQTMPHAAASLRTTQSMDSKFSPFVNTLGLSIVSFGMGWEDYLKLPISQIEVYQNKLQELLDISQTLDQSVAERETARLKRALEAVKRLQTFSLGILEEAQNRENLQNLDRRLTTSNSDYLARLQLLGPARHIKHQSGMAIKLKSQGSWIPVHAILLDNFLFWGRVKSQKKNKEDIITVSEAVSSQLTLPLLNPPHAKSPPSPFPSPSSKSAFHATNTSSKNQPFSTTSPEAKSYTLFS